MNILIIGATSAIATAFARHYAGQQAGFFLLARNAAALQRLADDLVVRGASQAGTAVMDASGDYLPALDQALAAMPAPDLVLMAHGMLGDQQQCEQDVAALQQLMQVNVISSMSMLTVLANHLQQQGHGTLAFIASVAGDRGRISNYVYGASKAALNTFLQGMRIRLLRHGVNTLIIKPGFVDTPMTASFDKSGPLWATPEMIAAGIARAVEKRKGTVYLPWFWRYIMLVITHIPSRIFNKLNL
ncbi:MAG TPA: SDR family oxidoreductase [Pseudomonadales bacterium]